MSGSLLDYFSYEQQNVLNNNINNMTLLQFNLIEINSLYSAGLE